MYRAPTKERPRIMSSGPFLFFGVRQPELPILRIQSLWRMQARDSVSPPYRPFRLL